MAEAMRTVRSWIRGIGHISFAPSSKHRMQRTITRLAMCLVLSAGWISPSLFAQKVSFGVITGSQLTDDYRSLSCPDMGVTPGAPPEGCPNIRGGSFGIADASQRFLIGPKVNVRFTPSLSVEVDALYRQIRSENTRTFMFCPPDQLPSCTMLSPFTHTAIGTDFSWEFPVLGRYQMPGRKWSPFVEGGPSFRPAENREQFGFTAGGGVELRLHGLRLSPGLRYTRWQATFGAIQDQFQLVAGIDGTDSAEPVTAFGRKVSLGVVAGLALSDGLRTRVSSFTDQLEVDPTTGVLTPTNGTVTINSNRTSPVVGIAAEIATPARVSVTVNALYRPLNARDISVLSNGIIRETNFTVLTWEFPILAKYKVPIRKTSALFELGPALRTSGNLNGANPSHFGVTGGVGMEWRQSGLAFSPTVRFTRWRTDAASGDMTTHRNQVELVFGVHF